MIIHQLTLRNLSNSNMFPSCTYNAFPFVYLDHTVLLQEPFLQPKYYT